MFMKRFFSRPKTLKQINPDAAKRLELMGQQLPAEKLSEIVTKAVAIVQENPEVPPEVAGFTAGYANAVEKRIQTEEERLGKYALLSAATIMFTAGTDWRHEHGDPGAGDFVHDQTGLANGANATAARMLVERAMGVAYYDMVYPPETQR